MSTSTPEVASEGVTSPRSVYYGNKAANSNDPKSSGDSSSATETTTTRRTTRRVVWHDGITTATKEFNRVDPELKPSMYYNKQEINQFRASEQRRIDKAMMKRIQKMVEEAMADEIAEAKARGATSEEIEAMMPQTPEAIFQVLGMPIPISTPPPGMMEDEPTSNVRRVVDDVLPPPDPEDQVVAPASKEETQTDNSIENSSRKNIGDKDAPLDSPTNFLPNNDLSSLFVMENEDQPKKDDDIGAEKEKDIMLQKDSFPSPAALMAAS